MKSLLRVPANAIDRFTPEALALDGALRARGMHDVADDLLLARLEPDVLGVQITGVGSADPPVQWSQHPIDHPYAKGKAINLGATTISAAGTAVADIVTAGFQYLVLLGSLGNATTPATAAGDISLGINYYEDDGATLWPNGVGARTAADGVTITAAGLGSNKATIAFRWLIAGIDKVRAVLTNNNVAALQGGTAIYYLQK